MTGFEFEFRNIELDKLYRSQSQLENYTYEENLKRLRFYFYFSTAAGYYAEIKKQENDDNPKPWKSLSSIVKKKYINILHNVSHLKLIYD